MTRSPAPEIVHRALLRQGFAGASDATLLARYTRHHDHAAFAELVERYARLVWGTCRRGCGDAHAAEDAFQATFIALARQAGSIRRAEGLPGWLHAIARRMAWRARPAKPVAEAVSEVASPAASPVEEASASELLAAVEAEVARLPEKYRAALLLCWFEDGSLDDAARRLGVSKGVLWGRLKRGRDRLRRRLAARGFGPPALLAAAALTGTPAAADLIHRTTEAAVATPARSPAVVGSWLLLKVTGALAVAAAVVIGTVTLFPSGVPDSPKGAPKKELLPIEAAIDDGFPLPPGAVRRFGNRQLRHPGSITDLAVSPDGRFLATAGYEGLVVWDLKTLACKRSFPGLAVLFNSKTFRGGRLEFSSDSKSLLVATRQGENGFGVAAKEQVELAQVWDIETGKKRFGLTGQRDYYATCWLFSGGKEIAVLSNDVGTTIRFFDSRDGKPLRTVVAPIVNQNSPWVGRSGNLVVIDRQKPAAVSVVDVRTGKEALKLAERPAQVALSRDDKLVVWADTTGTVHLHDLMAKTERFAFVHPERDEPGPMVVSADNNTLYLTSTRGRLFRWDLANNKKGPDFANRHNSWNLTGIALSPDESVLYSVSEDHLVKRWDTKTGQELPLPEGYTTHTSIVVATDRKHLIVTDHEGQIDYWELETGRRVKQLQKSHLGGINDLAESADGKWLAGGRTSSDIRLFDLRTGKVVSDISLLGKPGVTWDNDPVQRVKFAPDGRVVYGTSAQTGLSAWEVPGGRKVWRVQNGGPLLAIDPRGRWLAIGGEFRSGPVIWTLVDAKSGAVAHRVEVGQVGQPAGRPDNGFAPHLTDLTWVPDGSRLVSAHYDGTVRVWDSETRREIHRISVAKPGVYGCLACSADGRWLGLGGSDRTISVWELATGNKVIAFAGHDSAILRVAFTKDGRGLVSNADLSPILWDLCPKELPKDGLWDLLASNDAARAYAAQWALIRDPKAAVTLLTERVKPAELIVRREQFDKWVADLDRPQFRAREAAEKALTAAGGKVPLGWLRNALADSKADEPRARLGRVLVEREKPDPDAWRLSRAVQVLELAGTEETRALLKSWAAVEGSPLAEDAKDALARAK
jgi:RNA polymerase sigma factor (sigma-70 family)